MKGCVYLIGAGCGAKDLITLRGLEKLRICDVVVYDDLIDEALLQEAPPNAHRIYMGKRRGKHSASQHEISQALVEQALMGKCVARLKGGDPFVFGRGGEEALALKKEEIPFEEIPGISSAIAIPAAAGIPVTHRGLSRSFHVVTGHTAEREDGLPEDIEYLAQLHGTLIFLMGLSHLEQITEALLKFGKSPETPAAVLSGGNSPNPATIRGDLSSIAVLTRKAEVQSPAIIIVGETAALDLTSIKKSLAGVQVGLTGTHSMAERLKPLLEENGAVVSIAERSVVERLPIDFNLEKLCDGKPHWLVFTSGNGVRIFFDHLRNSKLDLRHFHACKFAVIGNATGRILESYGIYPNLCPQVYTSEELGKALCQEVSAGEDVILLRAKKGAAILPELLQKHKIPVRDISLYDLSVDHKASEQVENLDYLTFSSGGGVELYFKEHGEIPLKTTCVCIGEVTAQALRQQYDKPFLIAQEISAEGIVEAIIKHHTEKNSCNSAVLYKDTF